MPSRREIKDSDEGEGDDSLDEEEDDEGGQDEDADEDDEGGSGGKRRRSIAGGRTRMQRFKAWFRDVRYDIYFLLFVGGILAFVIGFVGEFSQRALGPGLESWFKSVGGGTVYLFVGGIFALLITGYLFGGLLVKHREFERLVKTKAKSDFIRNLDKVERLAFELGTKESDKVAARKKEFKIRH